jgi:hypothetical protein
MQEQEREWRASVEASIRSKEERRKSLLKEREAQKKQVGPFVLQTVYKVHCMVVWRAI